MRRIDDSGSLFPEKTDGWRGEREDGTGRQFLMAGVQVAFERIRELTDDEQVQTEALLGELALMEMYEVNEAVIARHEANRQWDEFRLLHRQLVGLALEMGSLAARRPEQSCNTFKAQQMNRVLRPLKQQMEEDMGVALSLVSEDGAHSYSDVCLILRVYQDVSAAYVHRHYDGNPPVIPPVPQDFAAKLVQEHILLFCRDEPKSILQIAEMLGYRDKKTVRKYLNPLLAEGYLARTVPDRPNSRNQRYITARDL